MTARPPLFTRGLSGLRQSSSSTPDSVSSPAEQRDDAKRNLFKSMRPLPTQHYWDVYLDRRIKNDEDDDNHKNNNSNKDQGEYSAAQLDKIGDSIESVQDFWRYHNNTPIDNIKMRESLYLFKSGFRPIWEDRRNVLGGSWTFRVPKSLGPEFWTRIQLLAIGEQLQAALDDADPAGGDQICGVGLSVRFNAHLVTVWHRDASKRGCVDAILACVLAELPPHLLPKPETYFYKKHSEHAGFKPPPDLQAVLDRERG